MKSSCALPPDPRITQQQAAQELLKRRGLLRSAQSPFAQALAQFARGEIYPDELLSLCESILGLRLPTQSVCPNHQAPGQYFLDSLIDPGMRAILWAARGTGKTLIGGLLTVIESLIFSECETIILGGSERQSSQMYGHVRRFIYRADLQALVDGKIRAERVNFKNKSFVQMLPASQKSVRGGHPSRLRLDEVAGFDPDIYEAAIKMPMSQSGIPASLHIYSTMNQVGDLMDQIVTGAADSQSKLYTWCIFDVAERCEGRDCTACVLLPDCHGRCQQADGYYRIDDIIAQRTTPGVSQDSWESEMLCLRPGSRFLVWPKYDERVHLYLPEAGFDPAEFRKRFRRVLAGVDWGYTNPAAIVVVGEDAQGILWAVEEFYQNCLLASELGDIAKGLKEKWGIECFFCDPEDPDAIETWRRSPLNLPVSRANNAVEKGVGLVAARFRLLPPHYRPIIQILSALANLRREIRGYRYRGDDVRGGNLRGDEAREDIIKKNDHAVSALRYVISAFDAPEEWYGY